MSYQDFEPGDISARMVAGIVGALLLLLAVSLTVLFFMFTSVKSGTRQPSQPPLGVERGIAGPRLQTDPTLDWEQLRQVKQQLLQTYAWVDEERGIARLPVTEAMALYAEGRWQAMADQEGLPGLRERLHEWEALYEGREELEVEDRPRRPLAGRQSLQDADPDALPVEGSGQTLRQRLEQLRGESP